MNVIEAYEYALEVLEDLRSEGIKVEITPYNHKKLLSEYKFNGGLPVDKWVNIFIVVENEEQKDFMWEKNKALTWQKIGFDCGGCGSGFDWHFDWSFHVTDEINHSREEALDQLKELGNKKISDDEDTKGYEIL